MRKEMIPALYNFRQKGKENEEMWSHRSNGAGVFDCPIIYWTPCALHKAQYNTIQRGKAYLPIKQY